LSHRPGERHETSHAGRPPDDLRDPAAWRVEKMDEDGGYECVEVFAGPSARQRAIDYARHRFGEFDEIELKPY
jgi:hypothetical protein